nr:omptin family outer membrane protease [Erwinia amylovora]
MHDDDWQNSNRSDRTGYCSNPGADVNYANEYNLNLKGSIS